jgi:DtxR family Mn-dependent transcriptional regulator
MVPGWGRMAERHRFEESEEMYLKSLYELGRTLDPVPVTALAGRLGITTVSASEMVRRLQGRKLLLHQPYKGVRLTAEGEERARAILRRHRLWERFLTDQLGLGWVEAHDAACQLEHAVDDRVTDALDNFLNHPDSCPHGNPIPRQGEPPSQVDEYPLSELKVGAHGTILRIRNEEAALLKYLETHAVVPGRAFQLESIAPFNGPRSLQLGGRAVVIGREAAEHVLVTKEDAA